MDVTVPVMTSTSDYALLRKLFGNPAVRLRYYFGGSVALRHWITPVLPLSEVSLMKFCRRISTAQ